MNLVGCSEKTIARSDKGKQIYRQLDVRGIDQKILSFLLALTYTAIVQPKKLFLTDEMPNRGPQTSQELESTLKYLNSSFIGGIVLSQQCSVALVWTSDYSVSLQQINNSEI